MHVCLSVCLSVCMYTCMHVCMWTCILIDIHVYETCQWKPGLCPNVLATFAPGRTSKKECFLEDQGIYLALALHITLYMIHNRYRSVLGNVNILKSLCTIYNVYYLKHILKLYYNIYEAILYSRCLYSESWGGVAFQPTMSLWHGVESDLRGLERRHTMRAAMLM